MSVEIISEYLEQYENKFYEYSHEEHIEKWVSQFDQQDIITSEIAHILDNSFFTEEDEEAYIKSILSGDKIKNDIGDVGTYTILDIQEKGRSQNRYSKKLHDLFLSEREEDVAINDFSKENYIYIDDFMFSGMKARHDIENLLAEQEGDKKIIYVFIGVHSNADYYLNRDFQKKKIKNSVWRYFNFENSIGRISNSDVFWPKEEVLEIPAVDEFVQEKITRELKLRSNTASNVGKNKIFSSSENRDIIEKEFLLAGIKIINECNTRFPPLGISVFEGFGFGGTAMSYRNIPNNAPLCLWWGNPNNPGGLGTWYPLMMRTPND